MLLADDHISAFALAATSDAYPGIDYYIAVASEAGEALEAEPTEIVHRIVVVIVAESHADSRIVVRVADEAF